MHSPPISTISVIIPAFNAEKFIANTLAHVFAQTRLPDEVIVVDDGSTDSTREVVSQYDVKYVYQENQGTAAAYTNGVKKASGGILAFLDHDDLWSPEKLAMQEAVLIENPEIDMVFSLLQNVIINEDLKGDVDINEAPVPGIHKSCFMVRRSKFLEVGTFSSESGTQEFLEWFANAKEKGLRHQVIPRMMVQRTVHGTNQTMMNKQAMNDMPKVLKVILDKRRKSK